MRVKRIKLVGATLPKIKLPDPGVRRVSPEDFARVLGAVPAEPPAVRGGRR